VLKDKAAYEAGYGDDVAHQTRMSIVELGVQYDCRTLSRKQRIRVDREIVGENRGPSVDCHTVIDSPEATMIYVTPNWEVRIDDNSVVLPQG
jgi:hypothetical protein